MARAKLSTNVEEILSRARGNFEEKICYWRLALLLLLTTVLLFMHPVIILSN